MLTTKHLWLPAMAAAILTAGLVMPAPYPSSSVAYAQQSTRDYVNPDDPSETWTGRARKPRITPPNFRTYLDGVKNHPPVDLEEKRRRAQAKNKGIIDPAKVVRKDLEPSMRFHGNWKKNNWEGGFRRRRAQR